MESETIVTIRDIAIIVFSLGGAFFLLVLLLLVFGLYRKVSSLLNSARKTVKSVEEITTAVSDSLVKPATAGSGIAFGAGKLLSFLLGFRRGGKKNGK